VKGWYDARLAATFFLLGSSSFQLADKAAESLAGRNRKLLLPQLTFWEIVRAQPWYNAVFGPEQIMDRFAPQVESLLLACMAFGHYPEAVLTPDKRSYLLNLVSDTLWKDLLQMGLIKTPDVIRRLLMLLAHQTGSEVSVNELSTALGLARPTVERYLELLEQAFVIFRLVAFSTNPRKEISKSRKIYFWDTGIRNALLNEFSTHPLRSDIGALWENWVVAEFARQNLLSGAHKNLYFWRSRSGSEVDLISRMDEGMQAYEIKWNPKRTIGRAFSDLYHIPVRTIDRTRPLFRIDEE
jgi:predicted AAA+ superfamily ATPase